MDSTLARYPNSRYSVYVKHFRLVISLLMLAVFGLSISAEVFATDSGSLVCFDVLQVSIVGSSASVSSAKTTSTANNEDETPCSDPCHYGSCHFGHCSFAISGNFVRLQTSDRLIEPASFNQNLVEGPCLEGPRRPPRLS